MPASLSVHILKNDLKRLARVAPARAEEALTALAEEGVTYTKLSFGTSPSAPGDPPGVDTGALRASIHQENVGRLKRVIADGVEYGVWLEMGTEKIAPRPFMGPMVVYLEGIVSDVFDNFLGV